jgi:glutamate racemase
VECIERGELATDKLRSLLEGYLKPLLESQADTIVLGCTHYPFVRPLIEEIVGSKVTLIDTGAAVARQLQKRLVELSLSAKSDKPGSVTFWSNSQDEDAEEIMEQLWAREVKVLSD